MRALIVNTFDEAPKIRSSKMEDISAARLLHDTWNLRLASCDAGHDRLLIYNI